MLAGLTQQDICFRAKMHQSVYSLIENGYKVPDQDQRQRLAEVLKCNLSDVDWTQAYEARMAQS